MLEIIGRPLPSRSFWPIVGAVKPRPPESFHGQVDTTVERRTVGVRCIRIIIDDAAQRIRRATYNFIRSVSFLDDYVPRARDGSTGQQLPIGGGQGVVLRRGPVPGVVVVVVSLR